MRLRWGCGDERVAGDAVPSHSAEQRKTQEERRSAQSPASHSPARTPPLTSTTMLLAVVGISDRVTFPPGHRTCTLVGNSGVPRTWTELFWDQKPLPA